MLRFIHTADFQIGKPYNWANDRAQKTLQERRERAIERVGEVAKEKNADFIVVAGDFFDANTIEDGVVTRACRRLSSLSVNSLRGAKTHGSKLTRRPAFAENFYECTQEYTQHTYKSP